MAHYFSSDRTNISLRVGIGIGHKSIVKLKFSAQSTCMHQLYIIKYCILLQQVYKNNNELPGTSMAVTMIVSRFESVTAY